MLVLRRVRYRWTLAAALAAFAAVIVVALMTGSDERSREKVANLPFDFRPSAGTSTDELIGALQQRVREHPEDFEAHVNLANAYLQMVRETGDPSLYTKADDLLERAGKIEPQSPELLAAQASL